MHLYHPACFSLILTLICSLSPAFGFKYQRSRWRLEDLPIPCHLNAASVPEVLRVGDVEQALKRSIEAWNQAAGLQIFAYARRVELESALADDGFNTISFVSKDWLKVTANLPADRSTGGTTCTWTVSDSIGSSPRHGFVKNDFLRAFDIALNAEWFRFTIGAQPNRYDVQSVITHELGHVLSLGHPNDDPRPASAPTMVERTFPNDTKLRTLEPDDIDGVRSIYRKVSGVLQHDAHWENMIWVDGDVFVPRGVSLKITHSTPQTILYFSSESKFIIEGELVVSSSTSKPIIFTDIDKSSNGGTWGGLEIRLTAQVDQISDCIFEGAEVALVLMSVADVLVQNCEFRRNRVAVQVVNGQNISIQSVIHDNGVGVEIQSGNSVEVIESVLSQNDVGVRLIDTAALIRDSNFTENRIGVEIQSNPPIRLRENNITHNQIGVRVVRGMVDLGKSPDDLGLNNLFSNSVWNLVLDTPPPSQILAQGNYWGELTGVGIDRSIRDDDEDPNLPLVQFEPALDAVLQMELKIEIGDLKPSRDSSTEGLVDGWIYRKLLRDEEALIDGRTVLKYIVRDSSEVDVRTLLIIPPQNDWDWSGLRCVYPLYMARFRVVNLSTRTADTFTVQIYLSPDAEQTPNTDLWLTEYRTPIRELGTGEDRSLEMGLGFPDLPIDGISQTFYLWPRIVFVDTGKTLNLPGKWVTIYEELADLVGAVEEIPVSALPGEEINVRYSIKNYGQQEEGSQTVRFYLSKEWASLEPPEPDYPLDLDINLPQLEGEWTSQLTIPADVPLGNYHLWMMVDADNDVIECNSRNNPATYLGYRIRIGNSEEEPHAVEPHRKRPIVWGTLKTALFQNFPNPFNPETWFPFTLNRRSDVEIQIYSANGNLVRTLRLGEKAPGIYRSKTQAAYWDGNNDAGEAVSSGAYFYELRAGEETFVRKAMLLK